MSKVAVIVGSARTGSFTRRVAEALMALAPAGLTCEIVRDRAAADVLPGPGGHAARRVGRLP